MWTITGNLIFLETLLIIISNKQIISFVFIMNLYSFDPLLLISGIGVWLLTMSARVRFPALPQFEMWIRSGTRSTQPLEDNWVATWLRKSTLLDLTERDANHIIPSYFHLTDSCRSPVDWCGSLGSCKPYI